MPLPKGRPTAGRRPSVALLIETSNAYARGLLHGIRAYVREHQSWSLYVGEQGRGDPAPAWLKKWRGDGVIARVETEEIAEAVAACGAPAVDVSAARHLPRLVYVETDDAAIAGLAAQHLLQRGFHHFGFCGDARFMWSGGREDHFQRLIAEAGFDCRVYRPAPVGSAAVSWEQEKKAIAAWIRRLPKPAGVMAAYDIRGRQVLDVCRELDVRVPDAVAVIGVDNDELVCELADPPLSSVIPDTRRTGYEAARLLDGLMAGRPAEPTAHWIAPLGVVTRGSTDVLATTDADISAAVRFIRTHASQGINVADVLRVAPLSRRVLEARFRRLLGRTPHEEITRVRIERIKELLVETELSLAAIAHRTAYVHEEYMSVVFKRETGQPPSRYRAAHRKKG